MAVFTLSFDLELAWGEFYRRPVDHERMAAARQALPRLLGVLEQHRIAATFAVVGHLLLEGCEGHPEMPAAAIPWRPGDWFAGDPKTDERRDPSWYAPSLVERIRSAAPGHDLGAHGFSHLPLNEAGVSAEVARAEVGACAELLTKIGVPPLSFVFPRNGIMHQGALRDAGFRCYRSSAPRWYERHPRWIRKTAHMLEQTLAVTPSLGRPSERHGLTEIPGSMLFLSREGFRRHIPMASRVLRAERALARAVATDGFFHLWMHPEDLVPEPEQMLGGLDAVLAEVSRRRARGELEVRTMAQLVPDAPR